MDKYRIDNHKLMYHVGRVNDWLKGEHIYPIYMELSPVGACNHRCVYCALDFMEYQARSLETGMLTRRLGEMGECGVRSIMYAGEGEPLLHKDIAVIIQRTKAAGIDAALTTNAVLLTKKTARSILKHLSWIKVSINAARPATYAAVHRTKKEDFRRVIDNMAYAADLKRRKKYSCALGMQIVLLPENADEVCLLAKKARAIGMDYLVVKPYSQHPLSKTKRYKSITYRAYRQIGEELKKYRTDVFSVIFRLNTMQKWDAPVRPYKHCLALPFWSYIDAGGTVWGCSMYLTKDTFRLGNIYRSGFRQIWESAKHKRLLRWAQKELDTTQCRVNCRMDEVNRFLWDLKHPVEHVNFI